MIPCKRAGLFFGSFNPVHIGHMAMANHFLQFSDLDEVWFVLSPLSPHKKKGDLVDPWLRLEMLHLAVSKAPGYKVCDVELFLPQPSYTSVTLAHLTEKFSDTTFALIMGADNLKTIHKWFNYRAIIDYHPLYVYPRPGVTTHDLVFEDAKIHVVDAPQMEISSSLIRRALKMKKDIRFLLPDNVYQFILKEQLYC